MNLVFMKFVRTDTWFSDFLVVVFHHRDPGTNFVNLVMRKHGNNFLQRYFLPCRYGPLYRSDK